MLVVVINVEGYISKSTAFEAAFQGQSLYVQLILEQVFKHESSDTKIKTWP
jgi:hypothetical protein